jgi:SAM-dependent methyltransferase
MSRVPPNLSFELDDLEGPWRSSRQFDFIHGRMLCLCFNDPAKVIARAAHALRPGGFLELQDALPWFTFNDGSLGTEIKKWLSLLFQAARKAKKDVNCSSKYKHYMEDAGLVDVKQVPYRWPMNKWPIRKTEKEIGIHCQANLIQCKGLESISMAPMTRYLGMTKEEVTEILDRVEREITDTNIHAYIPV